MATIKETLEVLVALDAELDAVLKSCADGKLTVLDIRHQLPVIAKARTAFEGAALVRGELKDLDEAEMVALYDKVVAVASKAVEAFAALSVVLTPEA